MEPVLLVSCSPRRGGNSDYAVSLMERSMVVPFRSLRLADAGIRPCSSCLFCSCHPGKCVLDTPGDGAGELFRAMGQAELCILVSPIYFYHIPAQAKAWVDRAQRFWSCGEKPGKGGIMTAVLLAARTRGEKLFEGAERTFRFMAQTLGMEWRAALTIYGVDGPNDLAANQEACARIEEFARKSLPRVLP